MNRTKLTVRRSVDGGLNYKQSLQINAGVGGYSCLVLLPADPSVAYTGGGGNGGGNGGDGNIGAGSVSGVGIAFERGISGDAVCSGGGCAISFEPLPADFVANGTSTAAEVDDPGNDCGPG